MPHKLSKRNSYYFNQGWINKALEDGKVNLLVKNSEDTKFLGSIGEYIERAYRQEESGLLSGESIKRNNSPKITEKNTMFKKADNKVLLILKKKKILSQTFRNL